MHRIRKSFPILAALSFILFSGCGLEADYTLYPYDYDPVPWISDIYMDPDTVVQGEGGGSVNVYVDFYFEDEGADISWVHYRVWDDTETSFIHVVEDVYDDSFGFSRGYLHFTRPLDTLAGGWYRVDVWVEDLEGFFSNELTWYFVVQN